MGVPGWWKRRKEPTDYQEKRLVRGGSLAKTNPKTKPENGLNYRVGEESIGRRIGRESRRIGNGPSRQESQKRTGNWSIGNNSTSNKASAGKVARPV